MLTPKENFLEMIKGGSPERYVKQYEALAIPWSDPWNATEPAPAAPGAPDAVDYRGVTWSWPVGTPGSYPVHGNGKTVLTDVEHWRDVVVNPPLDYPDELWRAAEEDYASYDRDQQLVGPMVFPGLFEATHALMGMEEAMCAFFEYPDEMHELIDFFVEWETAYVALMAEHLHPDFVFHHDDWGSSTNTFLSPQMFEEFYLEPYKRLYQCYRDNGFDLIIHHSDSYAATYVPFMIEMGVDVWQGGTAANDIPALVKQYGGQISFMTGIDNLVVDVEDWSREKIAAVVRDICTRCGTKWFIPCQTQGVPRTAYPEVNAIIDEEIDKMSAEMF